MDMDTAHQEHCDNLLLLVPLFAPPFFSARQTSSKLVAKRSVEPTLIIPPLSVSHRRSQFLCGLFAPAKACLTSRSLAGLT